MSTNVRIKQKALFKKKLEMKDIVALTGLAYGISDDNYRLIRNEMAENTLIYDENRLARGIDLWLDGTDILLSLSHPLTHRYPLLQSIPMAIFSLNFFTAFIKSS